MSGDVVQVDVRLILFLSPKIYFPMTCPTRVPINSDFLGYGFGCVCVCSFWLWLWLSPLVSLFFLGGGGGRLASWLFDFVVFLMIMSRLMAGYLAVSLVIWYSSVSGLVNVV